MVIIIETPESRMVQIDTQKCEQGKSAIAPIAPMFTLTTHHSRSPTPLATPPQSPPPFPQPKRYWISKSPGLNSRRAAPQSQITSPQPPPGAASPDAGSRAGSLSPIRRDPGSLLPGTLATRHPHARHCACAGVLSKRHRRRKIEAIVQVLYDRALAGDMTAIKIILSYKSANRSLH